MTAKPTAQSLYNSLVLLQDMITRSNNMDNLPLRRRNALKAEIPSRRAAFVADLVASDRETKQKLVDLVDASDRLGGKKVIDFIA